VSVLGFGLATGSLALATATAVALLVRPWAAALRGAPAARRADIAAFAAVAPLLAAALAVGAVLWPAVGAPLGWAVDHCIGHVHHPHLCPRHGHASGPAAAAGAAAWLWGVARTGAVLRALVRAEALGTRLAALGEDLGGFTLLPVRPALCHVVGLRAPRILVSASVRAALPADALGAALAHERAHLTRGDLRWSAALRLATAAVPGAGLWHGIWREAAEDCADDAAARVHGGGAVADAVLRVARLGADAPALGLGVGGATGEAALERRVHRLLAGGEPPRPPRAGLGLVLGGAAAAAALAVAHGAVHHAVETAWGWLGG